MNNNTVYKNIFIEYTQYYKNNWKNSITCSIIIK